MPSVDAVARHYDAIFDQEATRLQCQSPVEYAITRRCIDRWIAPHSTVADVGVGAGHYAELLAEKHCSLHLADVSQRLLELTLERLRGIDQHHMVASVNQTSAVDLSNLPASSCDAVLLLGPLYHLTSRDERRQAVSETARILKAGGVLLAAGINRLAYFRDLIRTDPSAIGARASFHRQFLQDGNLNPSHAPSIGFAHLTTVNEFQDLFAEQFAMTALLGVESFAGGWQDALVYLTPNEVDAWLELVEHTASTPEGRAASDHFLFIGSKR